MALLSLVAQGARPIWRISNGHTQRAKSGKAFYIDFNISIIWRNLVNVPGKYTSARSLHDLNKV